MNYLNIFLLDSRKARAKVGSGPREPKIVELDLLEILLPWLMYLLGAKSISSSLGVAELRKRFFWQVIILKQSRKKLWVFLNKLAIPLDAEILEL